MGGWAGGNFVEVIKQKDIFLVCIPYGQDKSRHRKIFLSWFLG